MVIAGHPGIGFGDFTRPGVVEPPSAAMIAAACGG
jgi:hypothetical protein